MNVKEARGNRLNSKNWINSDNTDRLYLFVDESGDTGLPTNPSSSKYFIINIIVCNLRGLNVIEKHFSRYRYFRNADKELKRYRSHKVDQNILDELLVNISNIVGVLCFSFCINKKNYIGPYLSSIGKDIDNYNPTKFRNFVTRISLEKVFEKVPVVKNIDGKFRSIELVFDRYLENKDDEENLKMYLNDNYNLPTIQFINQIDSAFCTQLQVTDILGSVVKRKIHDLENIECGFINIHILDNPDSVTRYKENGPDTQAGTGTFSSMNS